MGFMNTLIVRGRRQKSQPLYNLQLSDAERECLAQSLQNVLSGYHADAGDDFWGDVFFFCSLCAREVPLLRWDMIYCVAGVLVPSWPDDFPNRYERLKDGINWLGLPLSLDRNGNRRFLHAVLDQSGGTAHEQLIKDVLPRVLADYPDPSSAAVDNLSNTITNGEGSYLIVVRNQVLFSENGRNIGVERIAQHIQRLWQIFVDVTTDADAGEMTVNEIEGLLTPGILLRVQMDLRVSEGAAKAVWGGLAHVVGNGGHADAPLFVSNLDFELCWIDGQGLRLRCPASLPNTEQALAENSLWAYMGMNRNAHAEYERNGGGRLVRLGERRFLPVSPEDLRRNAIAVTLEGARETSDIPVSRLSDPYWIFEKRGGNIDAPWKLVKVDCLHPGRTYCIVGSPMENLVWMGAGLGDPVQQCGYRTHTL